MSRIKLVDGRCPTSKELYDVMNDVTMQSAYLEDSINILCEESQLGLPDQWKAIINIIARDLMQITKELDKSGDQLQKLCERLKAFERKA